MPQKLTSNSARASASGVHSTFPSVAYPGLLNTTPRRPKTSRMQANASGDVIGTGDVESKEVELGGCVDDGEMNEQRVYRGSDTDFTFTEN